MMFVFFYVAISTAALTGFAIGRCMTDVHDSAAYKLGHREGGDRRFNEGYADGFGAGQHSGFEEGEQIGRELQEAETRFEVGAVAIPYTTDAEN